MSTIDEQRGIMNLVQAREIFERDVLATKSDCVLVEDATLEFPRCFVFGYQSKKFFETGDIADSLVGHGTVLISREDGRVFETGSAFSTAHYVKAFEACGDPYGQPTNEVKILGWNAAARKVSAVELVKAKSGMGLADSKAAIDSLFSVGKSFFTAWTVEDAEAAVVKLKEFGFESVQLWSNGGVRDFV
ncbi:MAG: YrhB domain-containing protein [Massilia sp.]